MGDGTHHYFGSFLQSVQVELHFFELIIILVRGRKVKEHTDHFSRAWEMDDNENPMSKKGQVQFGIGKRFLSMQYIMVGLETNLEYTKIVAK